MPGCCDSPKSSTIWDLELGLFFPLLTLPCHIQLYSQVLMGYKHRDCSGTMPGPTSVVQPKLQIPRDLLPLLWLGTHRASDSTALFTDGPVNAAGYFPKVKAPGRTQARPRFYYYFFGTIVCPGSHHLHQTGYSKQGK